jgi:hypothetical protein
MLSECRSTVVRKPLWTGLLPRGEEQVKEASGRISSARLQMTENSKRAIKLNLRSPQKSEASPKTPRSGNLEP